MKSTEITMRLSTLALTLTVGCGGAPFTLVPYATDAGGDGAPIETSMEVDAGGDHRSEIGSNHEEAAAPDSPVAVEPSPESGGDAGSGNSGTADGGSSGNVDAGPCEGGAVYTHQVGVDNLTWQSCRSTPDTYLPGAMAACDAYEAYDHTVNGCTGGACNPSNQCDVSTNPMLASVIYTCGKTQIIWAFAGPGGGHVSTHLMCPTITDPMWF
jgi:hypothetical protein